MPAYLFLIIVVGKGYGILRSASLIVTFYTDIGIKIKVKEEENWINVKEGKWENLGFKGLAMRMFLVSASSKGGNYTIIVVPVTLKKVGSLEGQETSRRYPVIKLLNHFQVELTHPPLYRGTTVMCEAHNLQNKKGH